MRRFFDAHVDDVVIESRIRSELDRVHGRPENLSQRHLPKIISVTFCYAKRDLLADAGNVHLAGTERTRLNFMLVEVSPKMSGLPIAIVKFLFYRSYMFGPPNDEVFTGHPLASRGLEPYAVFEVEQSSWIRQQSSTKRHTVHRRG